MRTTSLVGAALSVFLFAEAASAESARERFLARLLPATGAFEKTEAADLSRFSTAPRNQYPTGDCVGFSMVAAMEAAFNRKYCASGEANAFRSDGYCQRFDAIAADNNPIFYWTDTYGGWFSDTTYHRDLKEIDISEIYFFHRTFSQQTAALGSLHETESILNFGDNQIPGSVGNLVNNMHLAPEEDAPFFNDEPFWGGSGSNSVLTYLGGPNFPQAKVDAFEFGETLISSLLPFSQFTRPFVTVAARRNARFSITDMYAGQLSTFGKKEQQLSFLERAIFSGYPIALHGAYPGHSMLLVGYDRAARVFHYKDHYQDWTVASYDEVQAGATYDVVMDVSYDAPAAEEMWLGEWDVDINGVAGKLLLRRTRQPTNSYNSIPSYYDQTMVEMPKDKWARVGSYFSEGVSHVAYGRLGVDGDDSTMDLVIDLSQPEGGPSDIAAHNAGFNPTGTPLRLTMTTQGPNAALYVVGSMGEAEVTLKRSGHPEIEVLPVTPDERGSTGVDKPASPAHQATPAPAYQSTPGAPEAAGARTSDSEGCSMRGTGVPHPMFFSLAPLLAFALRRRRR